MGPPFLGKFLFIVLKRQEKRFHAKNAKEINHAEIAEKYNTRRRKEEGKGKKEEIRNHENHERH